MREKGSKQHLLARLRNPEWIPGREYNARLLRWLPVPPILLLLFNSPEIWMTVAWALSNNRKKVNFCNEEMEVVVPKITDPYGFLRDEGAVKCTRKLWCREQWHRRQKTQNQGTSSKCTKMCINQIYAINPGFIPLLKLWEIGPILLRRKETAEGQKLSSRVWNDTFNQG